MSDDEHHEPTGSSLRPMRYRALTLNADGRILAMTAISAANDDIAVETAKSMVDGHAVELWDGVRFIEHFPPAE